MEFPCAGKIKELSSLSSGRIGIRNGDPVIIIDSVYIGSEYLVCITPVGKLTIHKSFVEIEDCICHRAGANHE